MAGIFLSEEEYTFVVEQEKDLIARAKTASPRAASHLQKIAKMHSDFLAGEEGKRAKKSKRDLSRAEREAIRLQRQQERLAAMQAAAQKNAASQPQPAQRKERSNA